MNIVSECKFLSNIVDQQKEIGVVIDDQYINDLFNTLPFKMDNIIRMFEGYYDFDDQEFSVLLDNLNYLEYKRLDDLLIFVKYYKRSKIILNSDLQKTYDQLKLISDDWDFHIGTTHETEIFLTFVARNNLDLVKYIYMNDNNMKINQTVFINSCKYGSLEVARWLTGFGFQINFHHGFFVTCKYGHIELAKWLYSSGNVKIDLIDETPFKYACVNGNIEIAEWLYEINKINNKEIDISEYADDLFLTAWNIRSLPIAKLINKIHKIEKCLKYEIFCECCKYDNLDFAKWLYSFGDINVNSEDNNPFRLACMCGHLNIAKWIYFLGVIDMQIIREEFLISCNLDYPEIMLWMHSLEGFDHSSINNEAFVKACLATNIFSAKWLYGLGNVDIYQQNNIVFRETNYLGNYLDIFKWLYTIDRTPFNFYVLFANFSKHYQLNGLKWIYSLDKFNSDEKQKENAIFNAYRIACLKNFTEIIEWIHKLGYIKIDDKYLK